MLDVHGVTDSASGVGGAPGATSFLPAYDHARARTSTILSIERFIPMDALRRSALGCFLKERRLVEVTFFAFLCISYGNNSYLCVWSESGYTE